MAAPSAPSAPSTESEPTKLCRFCFDGDEKDSELIAPCKCSGSQKYVHRDCLKRWQAHQVLAAASRRGEEKISIIHCNVCHSTLNTIPPSGAELLSVVRPNGAQIAGAIARGVLLVSTKREAPDLSGMPPFMEAILLKRMAHWSNHVFLLYDEQALDGGAGDERLFGVNLSREVLVDDADGKVVGSSPAEVLKNDAMQELVQCTGALRSRVHDARKAGVVVRFFIGGPCAPKELICFHSEETVTSSHVVTRSGGIRFGGWWELVLSAATSRARIGVEKPVVCICYGHARWGREQLQNEVLRGDWGVNAEAATAAQLLSDRAVVSHDALVPEGAGTHYIAPPS